MKKLSMKKIIIILFLICISIVMGIFCYDKYQEYKMQKFLESPEGKVFTFSMAHIETEEEYLERIKTEPSDIEGMTRYDKYEMGLNPDDGSDSDFDGLTDKEEIEIYDSNPKEASTAGDLYIDSYKVENGMDLHIYYEYDKEIVFENNKCEEIILTANDPVDLCTYVYSCTNSYMLEGYDIYAAYSISNYSGQISIDLTDILQNNNINLSDINILIYEDWDNIKKYNFTKNDNIITIQKELDSYKLYDIFIVQKSISGYINMLRRGDNIIHPAFLYETKGTAIICGSPILSLFFKVPMIITYNENDSNDFLNEVINYTNDFVGEECVDNNSKTIKEKSNIDILKIYNDLQKYFPSFEYKGDINNFTIRQSFFCYFNYNDLEDVNIKNSFDIYMDELPFGNFGSYISEGGNCAGISHLTAYLYNTGTIPQNGNYDINENTNIIWNLTTDKENETLLDKGLYDYKDGNFIKEHGENQILNNNSLSTGELEFVNMIGCFWKEANDKIDIKDYDKRTGFWHYDYELIEKMKDYIDDGKILDAYFLFTNGSLHAVNIYGYYEDVNDEDIIWFEIYDNNFPQDEYPGITFNNGKCLLKITKHEKFLSNKYVFDYEYNPLENCENYCSTSQGKILSKYAMIVLDENWNVLNDEIY